MKALNHLQLTLRQYLLMMALMSPLAMIAIPCNTGLDGGASTCGISLLSARSSDQHWSVADPYPTAPGGPPHQQFSLAHVEFRFLLCQSEYSMA